MGFFSQFQSFNISQIQNYVNVKIELLKKKVNSFITSSITINLILPLINGIFLGIGEILAKDIYSKYICTTVVKRKVSKY